MIKDVITNPMDKRVVHIGYTKEFKMYVADLKDDVAVLKRLPNSGHKWAWMSLLSFNAIYGGIYSDFRSAMNDGSESFDIFELDNIGDLIQFLNYRKEGLGGQI
jgi:hypothetical protein